jgi:hypothetical protein
VSGRQGGPTWRHPSVRSSSSSVYSEAESDGLLRAPAPEQRLVNLELSGRPYPGATLIFSVFIQLNCARGCPLATPRRDRTALPERPAPGPSDVADLICVYARTTERTSEWVNRQSRHAAHHNNKPLLSR